MPPVARSLRQCLGDLVSVEKEGLPDLLEFYLQQAMWQSSLLQAARNPKP